MSGPEAARVQPARPRPLAHDAFTRVRHRLAPDPAARWADAAPVVQPNRGILVLDDRTLDQPDARMIALVTRPWSGTQRRVVRGSSRLTLLGADGERLILINSRLYDKATDGLTKHDHCRTLLQTAQARGYTPACVVFDRWYASLDNRKASRRLGGRWLTQRKSHRLVNPDGTGNRALAE